MLFLTEPAIQYKDTFLDGLREFQHEGRMLQYNIDTINHDFERFLLHVHVQAQPQQSQQNPPDRIPFSEFWLIENSSQHGSYSYIGTLTLRHSLNDYLNRIGGHIGYQIRPSRRRQGYGTQQLHLGLQKARQLGLTRVLVTCDENNIGSKKVIERNGGLYENTTTVEGSTIRKLRYWINLY